MPAPAYVGLARWPRFAHYEVRRGHVVPTKDAAIGYYEPWRDHRVVIASQGASAPPYGELAELVRTWAFKPAVGPGPLQVPTAATAKRLADWCTTHGLLGLALQRVQLVTLAPRFDYRGTGVQRVLPVQLQYMRTARGWAEHRRAGARSTRPNDQPGGLVPSARIPRAWPGAGAMVQDFATGAWRVETLSQTWARFFPHVPRLEADSYLYPAPCSEDFWRTYGEPIEDFFAAAKLLVDAVAVLGCDEPRSTGTNTALNQLHRLTEPVAPLAVQREGSLRQDWLCPTLISTYAMMALLDVTQQRPTRRCLNCGKLFVSKAYQAKYCSATCRRTVDKRKQRAKTKLQNRPID